MSPWTCWAPFKFIKSVGYSLQRWIQVQVNVSIRYLSFARKTFSTGLFLLNTMTRNVHREIKEMCLPLLLLICIIYSSSVTLFFCLASMDFLRGPEGSFKIPENKLSSYTIHCITIDVKFTKSMWRALKKIWPSLHILYLWYNLS